MAPIPSNAVEWARGAEGQIVAQPRIHALTGSATAACLGWRANQVVISPPDLVAMSPAGDARDRTLCWVMTQAVALRQQASSCTRVSVELNAEMLEAASFETAVQSAIVELRAGGVELELESARGPGGGGRQVYGGWQSTAHVLFLRPSAVPRSAFRGYASCPYRPSCSIPVCMLGWLRTWMCKHRCGPGSLWAIT